MGIWRPVHALIHAWEERVRGSYLYGRVLHSEPLSYTEYNLFFFLVQFIMAGKITVMALRTKITGQLQSNPAHPGLVIEL